MPLAGFEFLKEQFIEANKVQVKKKGNSRRNAAPAEEEKKAEEPAAKSTIGDGEWGIKYDDECLKFEQEW